MEAFRIPRTGQVPLVFEGTELASTSSQWVAGKDQTRWHAVSVYQTAGGHCVVAIGYCTRWQGEEDWAAAAVCDLADVADVLDRYDPVEHLVGFPPGQQFAVKQLRLVQALQEDWAALVSRILDQLGMVEEVD